MSTVRKSCVTKVNSLCWLIGLLITFYFQIGCKEKTERTERTERKSFTLSGVFKQNYNDSIYISYGEKKDSTLVRDNAFEFKGYLDEMDDFELFINLKNAGNLGVVFMDEGSINVNLDVVSQEYEGTTFNNVVVDSVWGSDNHDLWRAWTKYYLANKNKPDFIQLTESWLRQSIEKHPNSPVNGRILYLSAREYMDGNTTNALKEIIDTTSMFPTNLKNLKLVIQSKERTEKGKKIKNFLLENTKGDKQLFYNNSGKKVTLIDFWASWCGPCRVQNRELSPIFEKYKDSLEVVSISLDDEREAWHNAIKEDKLTSNNFITVESFDSEIGQYYGIVAIPFNIVTDSEGRIIATNVNAEQLVKIIEN